MISKDLKKLNNTESSIKNLKIIQNFKNDSEIEKIFKNSSQEEILNLLKDIEKYYQEQEGEKIILAGELEKILFSIPKKYIKSKETSNLLNLYQNLNNSHIYKESSHTVEIEKESLNSFNGLYNQNFEVSINNYFYEVITSLQFFSTQSDDFSLASLFPITLMSKGYKVGVISPGSNDEKIHKFVSYGLPFLSLLKEPLLKTLSNPIPYDKFFINDTDKKLLEDSIKNFKEGNYISSISLIVPRIESILREIIKKKGGTELTIKPVNGNKCFKYKTFSECVKSIEIKDFFSDEMVLLLKAIFSNNYGLNIRNKLAHGILDKYEYTETANIIILIIILYIVFSGI